MAHMARDMRKPQIKKHTLHPYSSATACGKKKTHPCPFFSQPFPQKKQKLLEEVPGQIS